MLKAFLVCLGHLIGIFYYPFIFLHQKYRHVVSEQPVSLCCFEQKETPQVLNLFLCFLVFLQPISNADFIVPVEIDGTVHQVVLH